MRKFGFFTIIMTMAISSMFSGCVAEKQEFEVQEESIKEEESMDIIDTAFVDSFVGHYEAMDKSVVNIEKKDDSYVIDILLYQTTTIGGTLLRTEDDRLIFDCKSDDGEAAIVAFMVENDKYYLGFDESELAYVEPGLWSEFLPVKNR